jgi:lipopolysaccharide export system protein LptA
MAKNITQIVIATDTFSSLITKTNQLITTLGSEIVTANSSNDGANTTGNTNLIGIFGANTVAVGTSIRGGTVNAAANLTISSNAVFAGANAAFTANVNITNGATAINATAMYITGPTLSIGSNTTLSGNVVTSGRLLTVSSNALFNGTNTDIDSVNTTIAGNSAVIQSNTLTIAANSVTVTSSTTFNGSIEVANTATMSGDIIFGTLGKQTGVVTSLGATTGSPVEVYTWLKSQYKLGDITSRVGNTASTRASKILIATNGTDSYITEYAVLNAPTSANLGLYTVTSNTTNVILNFTPYIANLSMSLNITLTA